MQDGKARTQERFCSGRKINKQDMLRILCGCGWIITYMKQVLMGMLNDLIFYAVEFGS